MDNKKIFTSNLDLKTNNLQYSSCVDLRSLTKKNRERLRYFPPGNFQDQNTPECPYWPDVIQVPHRRPTRGQRPKK